MSTSTKGKRPPACTRIINVHQVALWWSMLREWNGFSSGLQLEVLASRSSAKRLTSMAKQGMNIIWYHSHLFSGVLYFDPAWQWSRGAVIVFDPTFTYTLNHRPCQPAEKTTISYTLSASVGAPSVSITPQWPHTNGRLEDGQRKSMSRQLLIHLLTLVSNRSELFCIRALLPLCHTCRVLSSWFLHAQQACRLQCPIINPSVCLRVALRV